MPYLDSKIDKHKNNCFNPVGKRLYIRDYDDNGKQRFAPWGLTCTTCGVVVKQKFQRNLTKKEIEDRESNIKLYGEDGKKESEYTKLLGKIGVGHSGGWQEELEKNRKYKIIEKLQRLQRKKLGPELITPRESGLRIRIKHLKGFYERASWYWSSPDKNRLDFAWDDKLVEQFLSVNPRPTITELREVFNPPEFVISVDSQRKHRLRGYVPDPEKPGWLKYDREAYIKLLKSEAQKRKEMMQEIIKRHNR
jgi:hypothetical protein